ncbi:MAG: CidA/LrgA family protein [Cellvibrionaceae bacterium]
MLAGFIFLVLFQFIGEASAWLFDLPIPGAVIGMALLVVYLQGGLPRPEALPVVSTTLTQNLALLFLPTAVGIFFLSEKINQQWLPILAAITLSTFITLLVTGLVMQWQHQRRHKE